MLRRWLGSRQGKGRDRACGADRSPTGSAPTILQDFSAEGLLEQTGPIRPASPERFFTPAALQRAWLAVKRAGGGAGVDGVTLQQFADRLPEELARLREDLVRGQYRPRPVRRILVPKANGGLRRIALWALRDRVAQRTVYDIIVPSFEAIFLPCSYGFRPGLGTEDAVRQVLRYREQHLRWVVHGDIQDCFDRIQTDRLMKLVTERVEDALLLRYVRGWLQARILNSVDGVPRRAGTSQGSVLSPLLANIYLHQIDLSLVEQGLSFVRYADDLLVCCRRKAEAEAAVETTDEVLHRWGLALNRYKTRVVHFDQGFGWLGYFLVRGECYRL